MRGVVMKINGHDFVFTPKNHVMFLRRIYETLDKLWPDRDSEGEIDVLGNVEFCLYRNPGTKLSWQINGRTEKNKNDMVHLIVKDKTFTIIVDDPSSGAAAELLTELNSFIKREKDNVKSDGN